MQYTLIACYNRMVAGEPKKVLPQAGCNVTAKNYIDLTAVRHAAHACHTTEGGAVENTGCSLCRFQILLPRWCRVAELQSVKQIDLIGQLQ